MRPFTVVIGGGIALCVGWCWLCRRHPMIAMAIAVILHGLFGGGGGR
jgi:hypothetical protein